MKFNFEMVALLLSLSDIGDVDGQKIMLAATIRSVSLLHSSLSSYSGEREHVPPWYCFWSFTTFIVRIYLILIVFGLSVFTF